MSSIRVFKLENLSPENTSCLIAPKSKMKYEENEGYGEERGNAGISHSCTLDLSPKTTKISYSKTLANTQNMRMKYGQWRGIQKKEGRNQEDGTRIGRILHPKQVGHLTQKYPKTREDNRKHLKTPEITKK